MFIPAQNVCMLYKLYTLYHGCSQVFEVLLWYYFICVANTIEVVVLDLFIILWHVHFDNTSSSMQIWIVQPYQSTIVQPQHFFY